MSRIGVQDYSKLTSVLFSFVKCCNALIASGYDRDDFVEKFLPSLERLATDTIADVRLAVARCISALARSPSYFIEPDDRPELLTKLIEQLSNDSEKDVSGFLVNLASE